MHSQVKYAVKSGHGEALITVALIAAAIGDLVPTPADALYFSLEKKIRDQWKNGTINTRQYWTKQALYYYTLNPLYWLSILGLVYLTKGNFNQKVKLALGIVGTGAVAAVIYKNIQKDIQQNDFGN